MSELNENRNLSTVAYGLLLAGGVLILAGGLVGGLAMGPGGAWQGGMGGMMAPYSQDGSAIMGGWVLVASVATGAAVLFAAFRVRAGRDVATFGVVAIVAGALSLLAMGGFFVGALTAIAGGAVAIASGSAAKASEAASGTPGR